MALPFWTGKCRVKNLWTNEFQKDDGTIQVYYNIKVADMINFDNLTFSCKKELYEKLEEGKDYFFRGSMGKRDNVKWWSIDAIEPPKKA